MGLGLYISKGIIERHRGTIGVISKDGEGSTFWFLIPIKQSAGKIA
jgi:signal transduction histidine kinase